MTSQTPDMQAVLERLDRLERQNRRLKQAGVIALIAVGALALMGQGAPKSRTVEAEKFILVDAKGKVRARLEMVELAGLAGPQFELLDGNGDTRATLGTNAASTDLSLVYPKGQVGAGLFIDSESYPPARSGVVLNAPMSNQRVELYAEREGPSLLLYSSKKVVWRAP